MLLGTSLRDTSRTWGTTWKNGRNTSTTFLKKKKPLLLAPTTQKKRTYLDR